LFLVIIFVQIQQEDQITTLWYDFIQVDFKSNWHFGCLAVLLIAINWLIEAQKWRILVAQKFTLSKVKGFKSICFGVSSGLITPHRIGEYGGRLLYIPSEYHGFAILSTFISSLSQNLVNIIVGSISALLFFKIHFGISTILFISSTGLISLIILCLVIFYFNIQLVNQILPSSSKKIWINKLLNQLKEIECFPKESLFKVLCYSFLRYFVYTIQYLLLLYFFGVTEPLLHLILGVSTIFLIQSSIPIPPIFSAAARGEIALLIWSVLSINQITILTVSYGLWIINLLIPATLGLLFLVQRKNNLTAVN